MVKITKMKIGTFNLKKYLFLFIKGHFSRVLQAVQTDIEKEQDRTMSPAAPIPVTVSAKDSEFITLGVVIRDLIDMVYDPEFSYWDKKDC